MMMKFYSDPKYPKYPKYHCF